MNDAVPRVPVRFVAGSAAVTLLILIFIAAAGVDISAFRDFERDVTMMRAPLPPASVDRYSDPSPHGMWLPSDLFVWDSIRSGHLPLWNRTQGGGYAALNAIHEGVLHPVRWLPAAFPRRSAPSILIVLILSMAFTGMYVLAVAGLGLSRPAAVVAALVFTFSAVLISFVHFSGAILPLAHIPWIVLFLRLPVRGSTIAALVITLAMLFVSGHPLLEACAVLTAGGVALADAVGQRSMRPVVLFSAACAAAVLIALPALLPPLLAHADLWTYKTQTAQGTSYFVYSLPEWFFVLRAMVVDVYPGDCCIDLDRFFVYAGIPAAVLAVVGTYALARDRRKAGMVALFVAAFVISVPGPWMALLNVRPLSLFKPWYLIGAFAFYLACIAACGFDLLWQSSTAQRIAAVSLSVLVAATYLVRAHQVLQPRIMRGVVQGEAVKFLSRDAMRSRVLSLWGQTHMPNASRITGIEDMRLAGPILSNRYHLWWQLLDADVLTRAYPTTRITDRLDSSIVGDFNIEHIVQSRLVPTGTFRVSRDERYRDAALSPLLAHLSVVFRTPWVEVRRIAVSRPRAHFAEEVIRTASLPDAVRLLAADRSLAARAAVVESDHPLTIAGGDGSVAVSYPRESSVVMNVNSVRGGLVVLHDSFAAGWTADVDGMRADVLPVNILSRGVVVPPGAHRVTMTYMPPGFIAGAAVSAAALLALILFVSRMNRRALAL